METHIAFFFLKIFGKLEQPYSLLTPEIVYLAHHGCNDLNMFVSLSPGQQKKLHQAFLFTPTHLFPAL